MADFERKPWITGCIEQFVDEYEHESSVLCLIIVISLIISIYITW